MARKNKTLLACSLMSLLLLIPAVPSRAQLPEAAAAAAELATERRIVALSAHEALAAMERGVLTSERYVEVLLARIARHPEVNAFISLGAEQALAAARAADDERSSGAVLGALHGLPILLKDNINTADFPTSGGTPALAGNQPAANAPVAQRLLDAGAILLGKTNMHELALGVTSNNAAFGPVRNPYDLSRIPGGSSGGNGAALAARFAPVAIGTDTAGSTRIPAALTGTMGLRPSSGRYPLDGIIPLVTTADTAGLMGRHVGDLALLDSVITGAPPGLGQVPVDGLRIGIPSTYFRDSLDPGVASAVQAVFARLESAGAILVQEDLPGVPEPIETLANVLLAYEWPRDLSAYLLAEGTGLDFNSLVPLMASPDVAGVAQFILANPVPDAVYALFSLGVRPGLQAEYQAYFASHQLDAVLYPTTPLPAAPIGQDFVVELNGQLVPTTATYIRNTQYAAAVGAPALNLPAGMTADGLPLGVEIAGPVGDDRRLLAIGQAIERLLPRIKPPAAIQPTPAGR